MSPAVPLERAVFFGNDRFSVPFLHALYSLGKFSLLVVTREPQPAGRKRQLLPNPVDRYATSMQIPCVRVTRPLRKCLPVLRQTLEQWKPAWGVVVAFPILPREILELFPRGILNVHPSWLPDLRGPAPLHHALLRGYTCTGISIIQITPEVDQGPILFQVPLSILASDHRQDLEARAIRWGVPLLISVLLDYLEGRITPRPQKGTGTYAPRISPALGRISWFCPPEINVRIIQALSPDPGAWAQWQRESHPPERIRILRARIPETHLIPESSTRSWHPGEIVLLSRKKSLHVLVRSGQGFLELLEVQPAGKPVMRADAWARGRWTWIQKRVYVPVL